MLLFREPDSEVVWVCSVVSRGYSWNFSLHTLCAQACLQIHERAFFFAALEKNTVPRDYCTCAVRGEVTRFLCQPVSWFPSRTEMSSLSWTPSSWKLKLMMDSSRSVIALFHQTSWLQLTSCLPTYTSHISGLANDVCTLQWRATTASWAHKVSIDHMVLPSCWLWFWGCLRIQGIPTVGNRDELIL